MKKSEELHDYWLDSDYLTWDKRCINSCEFSLWVRYIYIFLLSTGGSLCIQLLWQPLDAMLNEVNFIVDISCSFSFLMLWDFSFKHHFLWYLDPFFVFSFLIQIIDLQLFQSWFGVLFSVNRLCWQIWNG